MKTQVMKQIFWGIFPPKAVKLCKFCVTFVPP